VSKPPSQAREYDPVKTEAAARKTLADPSTPPKLREAARKLLASSISLQIVREAIAKKEATLAAATPPKAP
jgi:hypothetical protein